MENTLLVWIASIGISLIYISGFACAFGAVKKTRTAQGATAWAISLVTVPFIALPLYWVFGRAKFDDYIRSLSVLDEKISPRLKEARESVLKPWIIDIEKEKDVRTRGELEGFHRLSTLNFTRGNAVKLLVDGPSTFEAIFCRIDNATDFVLAQFYIIHDDDIGRQFKLKLIEALARGVRVYLLYDEVGSHRLPRHYLQTLREAGAYVSGFSGQRSWLGRFRLNFRNHRKIVIVDGVSAFMGGFNIGDEYLGRDPDLSPWRDTNIEAEGPAVLGLQYSFFRDWFYSQQELPDVPWVLGVSEMDQQVLILASGPADVLETCALLFTHAIESSEKRVWIATPYFVPDGRVLGALQLAALRGVDVRILMPRISDNFLFKYVPYAYLPDVEQTGVKVYLYEEGFMHQKVILVDNDYAGVSTANFDNRSFLFNFEITCLINDPDFCDEVEDMLLLDFANSTQLTGIELADRSFAFDLAVQVTRLFAPVL